MDNQVNEAEEKNIESSAGRSQKRWGDDAKKVASPLWQRKAWNQEQEKILRETFVKD